MAKKSRADKPYDPMPSNTAYLNSGFSVADCIRAEGKIAKVLREKLNERRVKAQQVLLAMLPMLQSVGKLEILEHDVRTAVQKVLNEDE